MKQLSSTQDLNMGSDPEFFFRKDGKIIGSEKVLPENGLHHSQGAGKIVRDGVQAELNPTAATCRQVACSNIQSTFDTLLREIAKPAHKGITLDFSTVVDVDPDEMETLSPKSRTFGCSPSKNANIKKIDKISKISVDPKKYLKRSAGGHIHLGYPMIYSDQYIEENTQFTDDVVYFKSHNLRAKHGYDRARDPEIIVPLLDMIVGNTCVLLDRDEGNVERRKVYGKAGEYRTPTYGIEYRTPSNFWLRSPHLASLVWGLARQAVQMAVEGGDKNEFLKTLKKEVSMSDVEKAINTNDFELAQFNWNQIENVLIGITPTNGFYPITSQNLPAFKHLVDTGIDKWFTKDVTKEWINNPYVRYGFNWWLLTSVLSDAKAATK